MPRDPQLLTYQVQLTGSGLDATQPGWLYYTAVGEGSSYAYVINPDGTISTVYGFQCGVHFPPIYSTAITASGDPITSNTITTSNCP